MRRGGDSSMRIEMPREFVLMAKVLNFSAAARKLNLSQSAMSTHVANLEKELGVTLFSRERQITLTPAGQLLLDGIQETLDSYDSALRQARGAQSKYPPVRIETSGGHGLSARPARQDRLRADRTGRHSRRHLPAVRGFEEEPRGHDSFIRLRVLPGTRGVREA